MYEHKIYVISLKIYGPRKFYVSHQYEEVYGPFTESYSISRLNSGIRIRHNFCVRPIFIFQKVVPDLPLLVNFWDISEAILLENLSKRKYLAENNISPILGRHTDRFTGKLIQTIFQIFF